MLGIYPEAPGVPGFVVGSPFFPQIAVKRPGQADFHISAPVCRTPSISSWTRRPGQTAAGSVAHARSNESRGELTLTVSSRPNLSWGAAPADRPQTQLLRSPCGGTFFALSLCRGRELHHLDFWAAGCARGGGVAWARAECARHGCCGAASGWAFSVICPDTIGRGLSAWSPRSCARVLSDFTSSLPSHRWIRSAFRAACGWARRWAAQSVCAPGRGGCVVESIG